MFADTSVIRALAGHLRERAEEIRDLAPRLWSSAREVPWQGIAADAMRRHVEDRVAALLRCAALHDDAADALEEHARRVDLAVDLLAAPIHAVEELL